MANNEQSKPETGFRVFFAHGPLELVPHRVDPEGELRRVRGRLQTAANRGDEDAREWAAILQALTADPAWRKKIGRSAHARLRTANRGPRTRPQEADALAAVIARGFDRGDTIEVIADTLSQRIIYVWPLLRAMTDLSLPEPPWPDEVVERLRSSTAARIARGLERAQSTDAETLGTAALRALGAQPKTLWDYRTARVRRS